MADPVSKLLNDTAELVPLARKLESIKRLQRRYRTLAPAPLAEASRICAIDGTTVVVLATSGPVAAALRQLAPRLLEGLRAAGRKSSKHPEDQEVNAIRIEVQVKDGTPRRPVVARSGMPREALGALARGLADSPLKESLQRIGAAPRPPAKPKP
ncbi:MAG: DciA family protein [Bacillota bacterium]